MADLTQWKNKRGKEIDYFREGMENLFDNFFKRFPFSRLEQERFEYPRVDVSETKNLVIVKAEIPGLDPKELEILVRGNTLIIEGERKEEKEEKDENYHRVERYYGSFSREIPIPAEVVADKIQASYKNGVLKIELPKSETAKKQKIKIEVK
jgi:HSP20 family protein